MILEALVLGLCFIIGCGMLAGEIEDAGDAIAEAIQGLRDEDED